MAQVSISASSARLVEGAGGSSTAFTFTIRRSGAVLNAGEVIAEASGLAGPGSRAADASDFIGGFFAGPVSFAAGQTEAELAILSPATTRPSSTSASRSR